MNGCVGATELFGHSAFQQKLDRFAIVRTATTAIRNYPGQRFLHNGSQDIGEHIPDRLRAVYVWIQCANGNGFESPFYADSIQTYQANGH